MCFYTTYIVYIPGTYVMFQNLFEIFKECPDFLTLVHPGFFPKMFQMERCSSLYLRNALSDSADPISRPLKFALFAIWPLPG